MKATVSISFNLFERDRKKLINEVNEKKKRILDFILNDLNLENAKAWEKYKPNIGGIRYEKR